VTGVTTAARYELRMQLRKWSMWITMAVIGGLGMLITRGQVSQLLTDTDPKTAMVTLVLSTDLLLVVGYGCLLADRLIRDTRLGVAPVLDATPSSPTGRLLGKYLGACAAGAAPILILHCGFAASYAIVNGNQRIWVWAAATFGAMTAPALLFVGAFALAVPLFMPAPLFRVLFVGYWFWGNAIQPTLMPTLANTLVSPLGGYPAEALFGYADADLAGSAPGATLNALRPTPTATTAWLSIGLLLVLAALALAAARAVRARATR
jgi:ABC-2 type transport system permease protein